MVHELHRNRDLGSDDRIHARPTAIGRVRDLATAVRLNFDAFRRDHSGVEDRYSDPAEQLPAEVGQKILFAGFDLCSPPVYHPRSVVHML